MAREPKSWWCWIYRGPRPDGKYAASTRCELSGGEDDAGLMETDLQCLFEDLMDLAHDDLTEKEIVECFRMALANKDGLVIGRDLGVK